MASKQTIIDVFNRLMVRFPGYMEKNKESIQSTMGMWTVAFKYTPDDVLLRATQLIIESERAYFPNIAEIDERARRVVLIDNQKIATYEGRLETYNKYKDATPDEIDAWVDMQRFIYQDRGWTTKDFKEMVETFKDQLNKAIRELPETYRKDRNISEV